MGKLGLVLLLAFCSKAMGYHKYYSYFPQNTLSDRYSSMSDIDWGKRSSSWGDSPAYAYSSMADDDWGWKKRSDTTEKRAIEKQGNDEDDAYGATKDFQRAWQNYFYNYRPIALARKKFSPVRPRAYQYHSMADTDWGWKKRKRTANNNNENLVDKRHIGSLSGLSGAKQRNQRSY